MTMGVFDFKAIANKLNCNEQKADFEEKNPKPVEAAMYGWPYGISLSSASQQALYQSAASEFNQGAREWMAQNSNGFDLPDLRGRVKANG
jgi:hypothetical protein